LLGEVAGLFDQVECPSQMVQRAGRPAGLRMGVRQTEQGGAP